MSGIASTSSPGPWLPYTPTVTSGTGSITAYTAAGRYRTVGKTTQIALDVNITSLGTAGGSLLVSLPGANPVSSLASILAGYDLTAGAFLAYAGLGNTVIVFVVTPAAHHYYASGTYETV